MERPLTSSLEPVEPRSWMISLGRAIAFGLCVFDLALGAVSAFYPELFFAIVHPELDQPQVELLRRTGGMWLCFAAVAWIAATRGKSDQGRWFLVLGWLRLIEVPADLLYGLTATGTGAHGHYFILASPPLNLAIGGYLFWLSRRVHRWSTWQQGRGG